MAHVSPDVGGYLDVHRHDWNFTSLFLLFIRFLPMIAMSEVKTATPEADPHYDLPPESVPTGGKERTR